MRSKIFSYAKTRWVCADFYMNFTEFRKLFGIVANFLHLLHQNVLFLYEIKLWKSKKESVGYVSRPTFRRRKYIINEISKIILILVLLLFSDKLSSAIILTRNHLTQSGWWQVKWKISNLSYDFKKVVLRKDNII